MNHQYKFRLRVDIVKAIPDIYNSLYTEYDTFERPVRPNFFINKDVYSFAKATHLYVRSQTNQTNR